MSTLRSRGRLGRLILLSGAVSATVAASAHAVPLQGTSRVDAWVATPAFGLQHAAIVGDFTGDGIDDEAYSVAHSRTVTIVPGSRTPVNVDLSTAAGSAIQFTAAAEIASISPAGDFDDDGRADLLVLLDGGAGSFVVFGAPGGAGTSTAIAAGPRVTRLGTGSQYTGAGTGIGDFDGDGIDDVAVQRTTGSSTSILAAVAIVRGGARMPALDATAQGSRTSLLTGTRSCSLYWFVPVCSTIAPAVARTGDFNGDGRADLSVAISGISYVLLGRSGAFTVAAASPGSGTSRIAAAGSSVATRAGDVNGDGRADLLVSSAVGTWSVVFGRSAPAATIPATDPVLTLRSSRGTTGLVQAIAAGDQDGDGAGDLLVSLRTNADAAAVPSPNLLLTHLPAAATVVDLDVLAQGPKQLPGVPVTAADGPWYFVGPGDIDGDGAPDLLGVGGKTAYRVTHGTAVTPTTPQPTTPAPTTPTPTTPAPTTPAPTTPTGVVPTGLADARWQLKGSAARTAQGVALVRAQVNQVGSLVWPLPNAWSDRTVSFTSIMSGGNGAAEGLALAFVPAGGIGTGLGGGGPLLGFGGLPGVAFALDVAQSPGDPASAFVGITDGVTAAGGLRWVATADPGVRLRGTAIAVKLVAKGGTVSLFINGKLRLQQALALPSDSLLAVTSSTGPTIAQTAEIRDLVITAS